MSRKINLPRATDSNMLISAQNDYENDHEEILKLKEQEIDASRDLARFLRKIAREDPSIEEGEVTKLAQILAYISRALSYKSDVNSVYLLEMIQANSAESGVKLVNRIIGEIPAEKLPKPDNQAVLTMLEQGLETHVPNMTERTKEQTELNAIVQAGFANNESRRAYNERVREAHVTADIKNQWLDALAGFISTLRINVIKYMNGSKVACLEEIAEYGKFIKDHPAETTDEILRSLNEISGGIEIPKLKELFDVELNDLAGKLKKISHVSQGFTLAIETRDQLADHIDFTAGEDTDTKPDNPFDRISAILGTNDPRGLTLVERNMQRLVVQD